jgi:hypothetical protein
VQYTIDAEQRYAEHMNVRETGDNSSDDDLAGVHDPFRVKELLDLLHPFNARCALRIVQSVSFVTTDTVLRRNGAFIFG